MIQEELASSPFQSTMRHRVKWRRGTMRQSRCEKESMIKDSLKQRRSTMHKNSRHPVRFHVQEEPATATAAVSLCSFVYLTSLDLPRKFVFRCNSPVSSEPRSTLTRFTAYSCPGPATSPPPPPPPPTRIKAARERVPVSRLPSPRLKFTPRCR